MTKQGRLIIISNIFIKPEILPHKGGHISLPSQRIRWIQQRFKKFVQGGEINVQQCFMIKSHKLDVALTLIFVSRDLSMLVVD